MKSKLLLRIFSLTFLIVGCNDNPSSSNPIYNLLPLKIGNSWIYNTIWYDSLGNITREYTDTTTIVGDTLIDSTKWYYMQTDKDPLYRSTEEGIYVIYSFFNYRPLLLYKAPLKGNEMYYLIINSGFRNDTIGSVEVSSQIDGTIQYKTNMSGDWYYEYIQNGIGRIKSKQFATLRGKTFLLFESELLSHNLK